MAVDTPFYELGPARITPWGLRGTVPLVASTRLVFPHRYDPERQINVSPEGLPVPQLATENKTVVDGDPGNPPKLDPGPKD